MLSEELVFSGMMLEGAAAAQAKAACVMSDRSRLPALGEPL